MFILLILSIVEISVRAYEYSKPTCTFINSDIFKNSKQLAETICDDLKNLNSHDVNYLFPNPNQHLNTININSHGFRGEEILKEKPVDKYRIFVVGGSTVLGYGSSSDQTTMPGYLQQYFKDEKLDGVEVINAGMSAANSFEEAYKIKNYLLEFQPDMIIVYDGWNDSIKKPVTGEWRPRTDYYYEDKDEIYKFFVNNSQLYRTPFVLYDPLYQPIQANSLDKKTVENITEIWKNRWIGVCKTGDDIGFDSVIVVQPIVGTSTRELSSEEQKHAEWIKQVKSREILNSLALSLDEISKTCEGAIDLRSAFDDVNQPVYWDAGHMGDFGNEIIAKKIFEQILPIIKEKEIK